MNRRILTIAFLLSLPLAASADGPKVFRWVDTDGQVHYGDSIPVEYKELPKQVLNERGVAVETYAGKRTSEERNEDRLEIERLAAKERQDQADQALLSTYLTINEIMDHRDRRVELFQAQSRVTEMYLANLLQQQEGLRAESVNYKPYSEDSDAPMIPDDLVDQLRQTKNTIDRHQRNLQKYQSDEQEIIEQFAGDISRFKILKGITQE
jgi:hypothetical protein